MLTLLLLLAQMPPPPPSNDGKNAPSAEDLIGRLDATPGLKEKDKPFEIAASLARLYFGAGRYADAQLFYAQALAKADAPRALYLAQKKALGGRALPDTRPGSCDVKTGVTLVEATEAAKKLAAAKKTPDAVACLDVALAPVREAEVLLGNARFLSRDIKGALAAYEDVLQLSEGDADARYARAAVWLDTQGDDVEVLKKVKAEFERLLKDTPDFSKATNAKRLLKRTEEALEKGGLTKVGVTAEAVAALAPAPARQGGQPPVLSKEVMEAFQNAPRTPDMEANFVKLIESAEDALAKGEFQAALDAYKQVMPYQPDNARLRAGMAWTMVKLNRQPMADNVWRVASSAPEAIDALGDRLKAKGDEAGAKALWQRLRETVPEYAPKLDGK